MQEDPSRAVNFVWAGSNGQPRGSYAMSHDPESDSSTFIPGNITSLFYALPGGSIFSPGQETATGLLLDADVTKFWFEVTEHGHKTVFDQKGLGFPLGETTVLPAEGSCLLTITNKTVISPNETIFSETQSLFVQIGVSDPVPTAVHTADDSSSRYHVLQVVKGTNPSNVSVGLFGVLRNNQTVVPAVFNQTASASNPHIDVWSVNITDQNTLFHIDSCVPPRRSWGVVAADTNVRAGSKSRPRLAAVRCRRTTPASRCLTCQHAPVVRRDLVRSRGRCRPSVASHRQPSVVRTMCRPHLAAFGESSFPCSRCRSERLLSRSRRISGLHACFSLAAFMRI
jgi:hypothetical protein